MTIIDTKTFFYHLFPLGACGGPRRNDFIGRPENRILKILESYFRQMTHEQAHEEER